MTDRSPAPSPGLYWAAATTLAVLALAAIWWPAFPVGTDTPTHLFFAHVLWHPERFTGLFETAYTPTSQLWVRMVAPLMGFGPALAGKLGLTLLAALTAGGYWMVGRALGDRRPLALLFGLIATHTFFTAMGFLNFAVAFALALWTLAAAIRAWDAQTRWRYVGVAVWMLAVAHGHVIVAGMSGLFLALMAAGWRGTFRLSRLVLTGLAMIPAGGFSLLVAVRARAGYQDAEVAAGLQIQHIDVVRELANIGAESFGGFAGMGFAVLLAGAIAVGMRLWTTPATRVPVGLVLVAFAALYLVVPYHGEGWAYAQSRLLVPLVLLPLAFAHAGHRPNAMVIFVALCGTLHLGMTALETRTQGALVAQQVSAFGDAAHTTPIGPSMDLVLDPGASQHDSVQALLHANMYAYFGGGVPTQLPAHSPMIHSIQRVEDTPPAHPPLFLFRSLDCSINNHCAVAPTAIAQRTALQGLAFQHVVVVGATPDLTAALSEHGVRPTIAPAIMVAEPTTLNVRFTPPANAAERTIVVRVGYPETLGWVTGGAREAAPVDGEETLYLGNVAGGEVAIEAFMPASDGVASQVLARVRGPVPAGEDVTLSLAFSD